MIVVKWLVLMTYLVTPSLNSPNSVTELPSTEAESYVEPDLDCNALMKGNDYDEWVTKCITTASPEPVTYVRVTKWLGQQYDTREKCQEMVDSAIVTWTAMPKKDRIRGMTLECKRAEIQL